VEAAVGDALVSVTTTEIADDWSKRWREFHKPLVVGSRLTVRPPWAPAGATDLDVVIDPGQAFGTGAHPTTRLCLELLLSLSDRPGASLRARPLSATPRALVDVGCGSGVLSIVAARLGFEPVVALDFDPLAVEATRENAAVNGVVVDVRRFDLRREAVPRCDVGVANVLAPPLLDWAASGRGEWPETLILSGLLATEADRVACAFGAAGFRERRRATAAEWGALLLDRRDARAQRPTRRILQ
jgi:ribosomal protein L11 methyltransferase